jgi:SAM-dependent methyltransferase
MFHTHRDLIMTMHQSEHNFQPLRADKSGPASTIGKVFADLHAHLARPLQVLELGNSGGVPMAAARTGTTPMESLHEQSEAAPDVVIIHPDLKLSAMVQALYAVRPELTMATILCGPGGDQLQNWPAAQIMLEQFIQDYRVEDGFWIARPSGLAFLKCLPEYAEVANLVAQVEYDLQAQSITPAKPKAAAPIQQPGADALNAEAVAWAFRVILDRDPRNDTELSDVQRMHTGMATLRRELLRTEEFQSRNKGLTWTSFSPNEPGMLVELNSSAADRKALLAHIQSSWEHLGATEPHWSVLTAEQYKQKNIDQNEDAFYQTGVANVDSLWQTLTRNGVDPASLRTCLEYGCGLGRVTRWLADRYDTVHGYDISGAHLEAAGRYLTGKGIGNVVLHHVKDLTDIESMERVDLIYSVIVLQHNPPPVIAMIVRSLLASLNPGGVAYFQVPTYQRGYRFSCSEYLAKHAGKLGMEMHVLPQAEIFSIAEQSNARVLEVFEDSWTGITDGGRSNTFVIRKT